MVISSMVEFFRTLAASGVSLMSATIEPRSRSFWTALRTSYSINLNLWRLAEYQRTSRVPTNKKAGGGISNANLRLQAGAEAPAAQ
ncbi:hypothetical protein [Cupriavidus necator]|uniref:hypothetical protein n=1 Tax=Cupriavidus necator TaxID=106590 RepID=UPI00140F94A7|nr:hypothetical protein [Cupriavidus necator]